MIPASLTGILFLCSLVPGALFLRETAAHRSTGKDQSTVQEVVTLIGVGVAITIPIAIAVALTCSGPIARLLGAWHKPETVDSGTVRDSAVLAAALITAAVGVALIASWAYNRAHPQRSAESAWHAVLWQEKDSPFTVYVEIELLDGRIIGGVTYAYDGSPVGEHRDVALQAPIRYIYPDGRQTNSTAARVLIAETEIRTITVQHV